MGKETVLLKSEEKMSGQEAAKLLRDIADKVEKGRVVLTRGNEEVILELPERVEVGIKAEEEVGKSATKRKLEVEIEWKLGDPKTPKESMVIS
ncbi:MAG TPA: amphi-Trp domain-containing protein [Desulfobacteraceae bacterium]|nr:amphi-Trp domain-containing protein [Desulfobacteraceae bacterium]|tara:strand:- start:1008 stop:1286 length:279 start_codon:yes stop_codon:yes gene_type:complete